MSPIFENFVMKSRYTVKTKEGGGYDAVYEIRKISPPLTLLLLGTGYQFNLSLKMRLGNLKPKKRHH